jgi:hypothetical protein
MCCSLLVTLMSRPSIARELAQDQTTLTLQGGLEKASLAAPRTLAKPVLKRLMRQEHRKRPMGDGTGVHMTTTMQQQACENETAHGVRIAGSSGELTPINDDLEAGSKPNSIKECPPSRSAPTSDRPFSTPSMQPRDECNTGDDSVIENLIGFLQEGAERGAALSSKSALPRRSSTDRPILPPPPPPPRPARPIPINPPNVRSTAGTHAARQAAHPYVSGMAMGKTESQQSFGRTPRGRMVPLAEQASPE